jgi:hypothetical protein
MPRLLQKLPVHIALVIISVVWTLPSIGLLIGSLRSREALLESGWWTVFQHPFNFTQYTLENYITVMTAEGMGQSFLNSLTLAIPATVIPIAIATFAAYALAWMKFPGRANPIHHRGGAVGGPVANDLYSHPAHLSGFGISGDLPSGMARPHWLRDAPGHLSAAQLHWLPASGFD